MPPVLQAAAAALPPARTGIARYRAAPVVLISGRKEYAVGLGGLRLL